MHSLTPLFPRNKQVLCGDTSYVMDTHPPRVDINNHTWKQVRISARANKKD